MGAGTKSDPTRIQIADLSATHYDPLARAVRQRLRAVLSRSSQPTHPSDPNRDTDSDPDAISPSTTVTEYSIPVVYSTEVPGDVALLPLADAELAKGSVDELAPLRDFRVRILPVLGPLPALFGLHIATYVLCKLAGHPLERPLPVRHRKKLYERMWKDLLHRESRIARKQVKFVLSSYFNSPRALFVLVRIAISLCQRRTLRCCMTTSRLGDQSSHLRRRACDLRLCGGIPARRSISKTASLPSSRRRNAPSGPSSRPLKKARNVTTRSQQAPFHPLTTSTRWENQSTRLCYLRTSCPRAQRSCGVLRLLGSLKLASRRRGASVNGRCNRLS